MIVEAANDPTTPVGDIILADRGISVIPDILANAGGVVASYVEWRQGKSGSLTDKSETYAVIEKQLGQAYEEVAKFSKREGVSHRTSAHALAVHEVVASMYDRCQL